jgi:hypothetical protein
MGALCYLSHAIEVLMEDIEQGIAQTTIGEDVSVLNRSQNASRTLLKVRYSEVKPENAFVSTDYRGHWFYIEDDDLH